MSIAAEKTSRREMAARTAMAFYKWAISPVVHAASVVEGACRFQPTCSEYAGIAIAEHGIMRGGLMALGRLLRCHPLHRGGFDPVPARHDRAPVDCAGQAIDFIHADRDR